MTKLKKNPSNVSAVLSDAVVLRTYRGQKLLSKPTIPRPSTSEKRKAVNHQFRLANDYAKGVLQHPDMIELYSKGINDKLKSAHTVAVSDFLQPPKVHYINIKEYHGAVGDKIRIKATDNFRVERVKVEILNAKGTSVEMGYAERYKRKPFMWIYTVTAANPELEGSSIKVSATDLPGHHGKMEVKVDGKR